VQSVLCKQQVRARDARENYVILVLRGEDLASLAKKNTLTEDECLRIAFCWQHLREPPPERIRLLPDIAMQLVSVLSHRYILAPVLLFAMEDNKRRIIPYIFYNHTVRA